MFKIFPDIFSHQLFNKFSEEKMYDGKVRQEHIESLMVYRAIASNERGLNTGVQLRESLRRMAAETGNTKTSYTFQASRLLGMMHHIGKVEGKLLKVFLEFLRL